MARQLARQRISDEAEEPTDPLDRWADTRDTDLTLELLRSFEWKRFELFVTRLFSAQGQRCEATNIGADGGIDAYLYEPGAEKPTAIVQCKAWRNRDVGVKPVRELFGVMVAESVGRSYFATSSEFTTEARNWAAGKPITLIDANGLLRRFSELPASQRRLILDEVTAGDYTTPTCPNCDVKLVLRTSASDGSQFWGCPRYPRCNYTLNRARS